MTAPSPERGEVWLVNFNPSQGDEINKIRPAVVVSSSHLSRLRLRIVVPLTNWNPRFVQFPWHLKLEPDQRNGLSKESSADALQIKSISVDRFIRKLGVLKPSQTSNIVAAITLLVEG